MMLRGCLVNEQGAMKFTDEYWQRGNVMIMWLGERFRCPKSGEIIQWDPRIEICIDIS